MKKDGLMTDRHIWTDSDGVAAGFEAQTKAMFGKYPTEFENDDKMWELIKERADEFWSTMPVLPDAHTFWEFIKPFNPTVLTGAPKGHFDLASELKKAWWKKHFNWDDVIVCLSKEKPLHMKSQEDILLDDTPRVCLRWTKAGGKAILYRNAVQAIEDFQNEKFFVIETPEEKSKRKKEQSLKDSSAKAIQKMIDESVASGLRRFDSVDDLIEAALKHGNDPVEPTL